MKRIAPIVPTLMFLGFVSVSPCRCAPMPASESATSPLQLLQKLAPFGPYPCASAEGSADNWRDILEQLFRGTADAVTQALNAPDSSVSPRERAAKALQNLEEASAEVNKSWPDEMRFHFKIVEVKPVLVVSMGIEGNEKYFAFAVPAENSSGKPNQLWQEVGSSDYENLAEAAWSQIDIYPLYRGPSGNARFLIKTYSGGCAGSYGVVYDAEEWDPSNAGDLRQIIKQSGGHGMDDKVPGFPPIGTLRTSGAVISLPYCWFSPIDTWDNPSLCMVDTYDLSKDDVKFQSRVYNRPDLVPVAKAIDYAQHREYRAVLGYCASPEVAQKLVRDIPPFVFVDDLNVTRIGTARERVELPGYTQSYRFDVEKRGDIWLVTAFSIQ